MHTAPCPAARAPRAHGGAGWWARAAPWGWENIPCQLHLLHQRRARPPPSPLHHGSLQRRRPLDSRLDLLTHASSLSYSDSRACRPRRRFTRSRVVPAPAHHLTFFLPSCSQVAARAAATSPAGREAMAAYHKQRIPSTKPTGAASDPEPMPVSIPEELPPPHLRLHPTSRASCRRHGGQHANPPRARPHHCREEARLAHQPKNTRTECTELETGAGRQLENEGSNTVYEYHNCIQSYKDAMQAGKHYDPEIDTKDATGLITRPRTRSTKRSPR